ncbi:MAG: hypothetical protein ABW024_05965 [Microbacterium sp.]
MSTPDERIEELIAAAVAGELTPGESEEFTRLRAEHPWIDDELDSLRSVHDRVRGSELDWLTPVVTDSLRSRIVGVPVGADAPLSSSSAEPSTSRSRRRWVTPLIAAACLVVGVAIGAGAPAVLSTTPTGPPGTLGAVEPVEVRDEVEGVRVEADLVAHTWGTEAVLDVTGLSVGETYSVVFIGADGSEFSAGEMLGSTVEIHCRLNAAVLREDAVRLEIRDADSNSIAQAALPDA